MSETPVKPPKPSKLGSVYRNEEDIREKFRDELGTFFSSANPSKLETQIDGKSFLDFIQDQYYGDEVNLVNDLSKKYKNISTRELLHAAGGVQKFSRASSKYIDENKRPPSMRATNQILMKISSETAKVATMRSEWLRHHRRDHKRHRRRHRRHRPLDGNYNRR